MDNIVMFIAGFLVLCAIGFAICRLAAKDPHDPPSDYPRLVAERNLRELRRAELAAAYKLVKEELGQEPTVEQILLTRDQLRTQRRLENGTN